MSVKWNRNGNWLLTASRDHLIKVYDIRTMREMYTLKGHKKDVNGEWGIASKTLDTQNQGVVYQGGRGPGFLSPPPPPPPEFLLYIAVQLAIVAGRTGAVLGWSS